MQRIEILNVRPVETKKGTRYVAKIMLRTAQDAMTPEVWLSHSLTPGLYEAQERYYMKGNDCILSFDEKSLKAVK